MWNVYPWDIVGYHPRVWGYLFPVFEFLLKFKKRERLTLATGLAALALRVLGGVGSPLEVRLKTWLPAEGGHTNAAQRMNWRETRGWPPVWAGGLEDRDVFFLLSGHIPCCGLTNGCMAWFAHKLHIRHISDAYVWPGTTGKDQRVGPLPSDRGDCAKPHLASRQCDWWHPNT